MCTAVYTRLAGKWTTVRRLTALDMKAMRSDKTVQKRQNTQGHGGSKGKASQVELENQV